MLKNVRLRGYIADVKLPPRPSDLLFPDSTSKDFWTKLLDNPSLEVSINIASLQLIVTAGLYVMPSIVGRLRISEPLRLQGLSHNRSTREATIMFFQQIPEGTIRRADLHEYYPKYDGLSSGKRMRKFEALWKSCTIWLPQYGAYILDPACLPGKDASMFTRPFPPTLAGIAYYLTKMGVKRCLVNAQAQTIS
ncbi:hypothetical protein HOY82DRAFT_641951 [Tuber indicum]|nr:hypothetical protein HOY82DRAFT_641951 [Tuber indicum]